MTFIILAFLLVVVVWICWPWPAAAILNRSLPLSWGDRDGAFTLTTVAGSPLADDPRAQARLTIPVHGVRTLVTGLTGWGIPPGTLRGGIAAAGSWSWNELGPGPRPWQAQATWSGDRARLAGSLPLADLNRLIACRLALLADCPLTRAAVTRLRINDDDEPASLGTTRRLAITAAGEVTWRYLGMENVVSIRGCNAWLHVRLVPVADGLQPVTHLEITDLDTPLLSLPLVGQVKRIFIPVIEQAVDRSLAMRLAGVVIPAWVPTDLGLVVDGR